MDPVANLREQREIIDLIPGASEDERRHATDRLEELRDAWSRWRERGGFAVEIDWTFIAQHALRWAMEEAGLSDDAADTYADTYVRVLRDRRGVTSWDDLPPHSVFHAEMILDVIEALGGVEADGLVAGPFKIVPKSRAVFVEDQEVERLTRHEWSLFIHLARDPHRVFTKSALMRSVWGHEDGSSRTLDSHACRLRKKLAAAGVEHSPVNVWGVGYRLLDVAVKP